MRELVLSLAIGALVALGLLLLLSLEPSSARVDLPKPHPRPPLLDQPYRPRAPAAR